MQHPASSQLLIPSPGATSQSLTCLNSTSHFMLPVLCFPASLFQSFPNPSFQSSPPPRPKFSSLRCFLLLTQPWECSKARLSLLCPWHCSQAKQLPGNPCSSCSAPGQGMLTLVWGHVFGKFTCQSQVASPQVSHNVPAKYQGLTRISPDFLTSCMNVFLPVSKYKAWGWHPTEELQPKQVWQCWDLKLWSYNGKCLASAASGAAASATTVPSVRHKQCLATGLFGFNFSVSLSKPWGLWVLNKARYQTQLIQSINQEYNGCFHSLGKFSCINSPEVKRLLFNVTIKQILWAFPNQGYVAPWL